MDYFKLAVDQARLFAEEITGEFVRQSCPDCPDGQVWDERGPTGAACPTCYGKAYVVVVK